MENRKTTTAASSTLNSRSLKTTAESVQQQQRQGTMGPLLKKEIVTTTQPDGTIVTKTTEMRSVESSDYDFEESEFNFVYCCTPLAALRIAQIIVSFIIIGCVCGVIGTGSFTGVLGGQTYVLVVACLCVIVTFVILVVYLFGFHTHVMEAVPWRIIDLIYSIIAVVLFLIAGCVEVWYATGAWEHGYDKITSESFWSKLECKRVAPGSSNYECSPYVPWIIAAGFCFINVMLYAIGACLASLGKHYL